MNDYKRKILLFAKQIVHSAICFVDTIPAIKFFLHFIFNRYIMHISSEFKIKL